MFYRSYEDIPAVLVRYDGKRSEVFRNDELYPKLGEPIAPTIEKIPALEIVTTTGPYLFFGNGIHLKNIEGDYQRLKMAFESEKQKKLEAQKNGGLLGALFGRPRPQQSLPEQQATAKIEAGKENAAMTEEKKEES